MALAVVPINRASSVHTPHSRVVGLKVRNLVHKMDGDGKSLAWPSGKELSWVGSRVVTGAGLDTTLRVSNTGHLDRILLLVK
jgi:hypothetical protein